MEITIYGITYECPHRKRRNDCPLCEVDHLIYEEKIDWIKRLNEEKKRLIAEFHVHCSKRREIL